jgi:hypothetical protein
MVGRFPCLTCVAFGVILLGVPATGHAQLEYHLVAGASVGASDNPNSLPDGAGAQAEAFLTALGRLELAYVGGLTQNRIAYGIMATSWTGNAGNLVLTHTLSMSSDIEASAATRITLNGGAVLTQMSMIDTVLPNNPQVVGPRPAGDQRFFGADAGEILSWQFGGSWNLHQGLAGRFYRPLNSETASSSNKGLTLDAALANSWQRDDAGVRCRFDVMDAGGGAATGASATASGVSEFARFDLTWSHRWSAELSHALAGGGFLILGDSRRPLPALSASVLWASTGRQIGLRAEYAATSNVYVGTIYVQSLVGLRVSLPLGSYDLLVLGAGADVEQDSSSDAANGPTGSANVISARLGLHWAPGDMFSYGLDYTFRDQRASDVGPGATSMFATIHRHLVVFTVEMRYPSAH